MKTVEFVSISYTPCYFEGVFWKEKGMQVSFSVILKL